MHSKAFLFSLMVNSERTLNVRGKSGNLNINVYSSLLIRALDKREYLVIIRDNFCYFCIKTYVVTPHLKCLNEMVQMRGHNIYFDEK